MPNPEAWRGPFGWSGWSGRRPDAGRRLRAAVLLWLSALAGCAPVTPPPAPAGSPEALRALHRERVAALDDWRVVGRFALQAGDEGHQGRLDWRERRDALELKLSGPFSIGGVVLSGAPGRGIELRDGDGQVTRAADADSLLARTTGLRIPVAGLRYWVRGLTALSAVSEARYDAYGRIEKLRQDGWVIDYRAYVEVAEDAGQPVDESAPLTLPRKLFLERDDLKVRLVVERWET